MFNIFNFNRKEKSSIPYLIVGCVKEVERRGVKEVGIYRVSGLSSDIQRLKRAFESSKLFLINNKMIHLSSQFM